MSALTTNQSAASRAAAHQPTEHAPTTPDHKVLAHAALKRAAERVAPALAAWLPEDAEPRTLYDAMRHGVFPGGKRLRPALAFAAAEAAGGDEARALPAALAVELLHSYSLVHDDLPCMDDDDLRRGRPSCHRKFGEATALLAGDALLTMSFAQLARAGLGDRAHEALARAAGHAGMVGGQALDVEGKARTPADLRRMHSMKTGCLVEASVELGAMCAGAGSGKVRAIAKVGRRIGLAYQIADDIRDATGSERAAGKRVRTDGKRGRRTMVTGLGLKPAALKLRNEVRAVRAGLDGIREECPRLRGMVGEIFPAAARP